MPIAGVGEGSTGARNLEAELQRALADANR
jgi:hypothetical protein